MFSRILNLRNLIFFFIKFVICFELFQMDFHLRIKIYYEMPWYISAILIENKGNSRKKPLQKGIFGIRENM